MKAAFSSSNTFEFNHDHHQRDKLLGINVDWKDEDVHGGIQHFNTIDIEILEALLAEKFINPDDRQNASPNVSEFFSLMKDYPAIRAFGYATSPFREDYRVSIEGIFVPPDDVTAELRDEFGEFCYNADEVETGMTLRGWWD